MSTPEPFTLRSQTLGCLPVVNWFLARMGLAEILGTYLPHDDARLRLAPAAVIGVVVRNIPSGHRPVYALGEWAAPDDPAVLALAPGEPPRSTTTGSGGCWPALQRRPGQSEHQDGAGGDPRLRCRDRPTTQRLDHRHGDRELPRRRRPRTGRETDPRDRPWPQQGLPSRPQAAAVHPDRLRRRCGPDRLPGHRRQHPRRPHPHPDLGRATANSARNRP